MKRKFYENNFWQRVKLGQPPLGKYNTEYMSSHQIGLSAQVAWTYHKLLSNCPLLAKIN